MKLNILLIILFLTGCNMIRKEPSDKEIIISMNQTLECADSLKRLVLSEGNTKAYRSLNFAYLDYPISAEFLLYALVMANKYNLPQAYFDVFNCLTSIFFNDLTKIDEKTADIAINYLLIASEKGHRQAKEMVEKNNISLEEDSREQVLRIYPPANANL